MKNPAVKKIDNFLKASKNQIGVLFAKIKELEGINKEFKLYLEPNARKQCIVVNFSHNHLIILTTTSSFATHLRFQTTDLLNKFKGSTKLKTICYLHIKVSPFLATQSFPHFSSAVANRKMQGISPATAKMMIDIAKTLNHDRLSEAMCRIAKHGEKTS